MCDAGRFPGFNIILYIGGYGKSEDGYLAATIAYSGRVGFVRRVNTAVYRPR